MPDDQEQKESPVKAANPSIQNDGPVGIPRLLLGSKSDQDPNRIMDIDENKINDIITDFHSPRTKRGATDENSNVSYKKLL